MSRDDENQASDAKCLDLCERRRIFGSHLKTLREAKGLSVADVTEKTRISGEFVDSLETGSFENLPGRLFGRGYVAALLKIYDESSEAMLADFDQLWTNDGIRPSISDATKQRLAGKPGYPALVRERSAVVRKCVSLLVLVGVIVLVVGAAYFGYSKGKAHLSRFLKQGKNSAEEKSVEPSVDTGDGEMAVQHFVSKGDGDQILTVTVLEPVKIKTESDDEKAVLKDYEVGTYRFNFQESMDLLVYDAAAVSINFNGNQLGTLGTKGRVRRVGFRAKGPGQTAL